MLKMIEKMSGVCPDFCICSQKQYLSFGGLPVSCEQKERHGADSQKPCAHLFLDCLFSISFFSGSILISILYTSVSYSSLMTPFEKKINPFLYYCPLRFIFLFFFHSSFFFFYLTLMILKYFPFFVSISLYPTPTLFFSLFLKFLFSFLYICFPSFSSYMPFLSIAIISPFLSSLFNILHIHTHQHFTSSLTHRMTSLHFSLSLYLSHSLTLSLSIYLFLTLSISLTHSLSLSIYLFLSLSLSLLFF
ncbi:unnamed protein product [Acanthosepion pharaonis]|uniref:Uncharacterized protein n=1 Tax=Acanthosepion pharaonis TaxID=158019 RepID=A0A812BF15_ACAPH|nr:unnamed protein product [Sepia pharaonis]